MGAVIERAEKPYFGEAKPFLDAQTREIFERQRRGEQEAYDRAIEADRRRVEEDRARVKAESDRKQAQSAARQQAYAQWGQERNRLRDAVAELRGELRGAEDRVAGPDLEDAKQAVLEREVFASRLRSAEAEFAACVQREPRWYGG
jgi:chromosome segregation ATPase